MTNRTLFTLTCLVLGAILALLALNMTSILTGTPKGQTYLGYNDVSGIAVRYRDQLYTLNFNQQNSVINYLNRSVRLNEIEKGERENPEIDQIIIYRFGHQPNVLIKPLTYLNHNLIFSAPLWDSDNDFMELSRGELQNLLSQTFDH